MSTPNEKLARRWFEEVWNQRKTDTVYELLTPESVCDHELGPIHGIEPFLELVYNPFVSAFPDLRVTVEATVSEGDQVVVRWRATGTHTGEGLGIPPSGKKVSFRGVSWLRGRDGKLVEGWDSWNQGGLIQALAGATSPPSMSVV